MSCSIIRNQQTNEIERVLAPNGKDSILFNSLLEVIPDREESLRTWAQTYTPTFKQWFGDSKVVDENGEPLLTWHHSRMEFDEFIVPELIQAFPTGIFTTPNKEYSKKFGNIAYPVFVRITDPGTLTKDIDNGTVVNAREFDPRNEGKDGFIGNEFGFDNVPVYVSFDPNQIKAVTNSGGFSTDTNNIYYSLNSLADEALAMQIEDLTKGFGLVPASNGKEKGYTSSYDRITKNLIDNLKYWTQTNPKYTRIKPVWNKTYNLIQFYDTLTGNIYFQEGSDTVLEPAVSDLTLGQVRKLLKGIGFTDETIQEVEKIQVNGETVDANGLADIANRVIQYAKGKESVALPEEAMHFIVELVQQNQPELFSSLMKNVTSYKIYKNLINSEEYRNAYRLPSGAIDMQKMKKEAIAKVLVEVISNRSDVRQYEEEKAAELTSIWMKILNFLRSFFLNKENPFESIVQDILDENYSKFGDIKELDTNDFYFALNINERDAQYSSNKQKFEEIRTKASRLGITKQNEKYFKNGKEHTRRVSEEVEKLYKSKFGTPNFPEHLQALYDKSRDDGTFIHSVIESIAKMYIDTDTGLLRDKVAPVPDHIANDPTATKVFKLLHKNIVDRLKQFPEGTRFAIEQIIYNDATDMAGTIDILAIEPDGEVSIYDWKTIIQEEYSKHFGLKDFKREAYSKQIGLYRDILKTYGITDFGYLRMIPITKSYDTGKDGKLKLTGIRIGNAQAELETEESLKPFIFEEETTGDKKLDTFLQALKEQITQIKQNFKGKRSDFPSELVLQLHKIIYDIRTGIGLNLNMENLLEHVSIQVADTKRILETIEKNEYRDTESLNNVLAELRFLRSSLEYLEQSRRVIRLIDEDTFEANVDDVNELERLLNSANDIVEQLNDKEKELLDAYAKEHRIMGLLVPERVMGLWSRLARSVSQAPTAARQLLFKLTNRKYQVATTELDEKYRKLQDLRYKLELDAAKRGTTVEKLMDKLFKKDKDGKYAGQFISELSTDFFKERDIIMQSKDVDKKKAWFYANYRVKDYQAWYKQALAEYKENVNSNTYSEIPKIDKAIKKKKIGTFIESHDIVFFPATAISQKNYEFWNKFIDIDKWRSKEYLEVTKIPVLLEAFNYFRSINSELRSLGLFDGQNSYTFIPNVRKSLAESIMMDEKNLKRLIPFNNFLNTITTSDESLSFGKVDPRTGEKIDEIQTRFIKDNFNRDYTDKTRDLFSAYYLMSQELVQYKYLSQVEDIAKSLLHIERGKGSIDKTGQIAKDNSINANSLQQDIRGLIYGQTIQNLDGYTVSFKYNQFVEGWNKSKMGSIKKLTPIKQDEVKFSLTKFLMKMNSFNQVRVLTLNLPSAIANLFGGTASTYLLGKKYITSQDLTEAMAKIESNAWYATEEMQKRAALVDYFLPIIDQKEGMKAAQLSVAKASSFLSGEWMMALQRKTDDFIQLNIFLASIENFTLQDGKLVSIRKMIQAKNGYSNRFNLNTADRVALENKVEKEIKEYRAKNSLPNQVKYESRMINGKKELFITLPGLERTSDEVLDFRNLVQTMTKDALGNISQTDLAAYKYNLLARMFMSFKNWIPRTADVRFGEFRYDAGHDSWEYGRYRMMFKSLAGNVLMSLAKITPLIGRVVANKEDQQYLINRAKEIYIQKVEAMKAKGLYNEETMIKEDEFIDAYIQGVNASFAEFRTAMILSLLLMTAFLTAGEDDDDETKNFKRKMAKVVDKMSDELSFFYSPTSFLDIMGSKPIPAISMLTDSQGLITHFMKEVFGTIFQNEEWTDSAKPSKYFFKMFPISKEIVGYIPIFDPELAKEMGITLTVNNRN